ncbi:hypothetical protein FRC10_006696 [Ceratobasidium sp. 414]|nr:hypothetical protein FRC10_006696 [Ceratobasidium sp. 414]
MPPLDKAEVQPGGASDQIGPDEQPETAPATPRYLVDFGVIRNAKADPEIREVEVECTENNHPIHAEELNPSIEPVKQSRARSIRGYGSKSNAKLVSHPVASACPLNSTRKMYYEELKAIIGSPKDHEQLKPIAPFTRSKQPDRDNWHRRRMLRGKPTISNLDLTKLGFYDIPEQYRDKFDVESSRSWDASLGIYLKSLLPSLLDVNTYKDHWTHLLWHEELKMDPSIIATDIVAVKGPDPLHPGPTYGGYVTDVQQSDVILRMPESYSSLLNQRWDVRFTVNRLLLRRMHAAINKSGTHERILFPSSSHERPYAKLNRPMTRLDRKVAGNHKQTLAVQQILTQPPGDIPFILFGPPGTGKTTALVEAIHQVVVADPKNRVLVCAPSNTATDLIALRLSKMHNSGELLRLNAPARKLRTLPSDLRKYSFVEEDKFKAPVKQEIEKFRIVASTCFYASIPQALGIQDHFTHIFVDEAGHASEPEIMVAILQNAGLNTNVVLCGDVSDFLAATPDNY